MFVFIEVSPRLLKVVGGRGGCPGLLSDLSECILFSLLIHIEDLPWFCFLGNI